MPLNFKIDKKRTMIMGVLNMTPDSFSNDGLLRSSKRFDIAACVRQMAKDGADIIDLGAESSRPNARPITVNEELQRLSGPLKTLARIKVLPFSVDTYKADVALAGLDHGAVVINNIYGCAPDRDLVKHVIRYKAYLSLMHSRGNPITMGRLTKYKNFFSDMRQELLTGINFCLDLGLKKDKIIIDPGIGFAKTVDHNLRILNNIGKINDWGFPVLIGPSRKSFIGHVLGANVKERDWGTAASVAVAVRQQVSMIRVHDVKHMVWVARMTEAINQCSI